MFCALNTPHAVKNVKKLYFLLVPCRDLRVQAFTHSEHLELQEDPVWFCWQNLEFI